MVWGTADGLVALIAFAVATLWTPGPNNILLASSGANFGFRRTIPHAAGVALGAAFMFFAVAVGLGELFRAAPVLERVLGYVGFAIMLWIAWRIGSAGRAGAGRQARPWSFLKACAFQWINPKAWSMAIGVASAYVTGRNPVAEAGFVAAIFALIGSGSAAGWSAFGAGLRRWLSSDRRLRAFNMAMGLLVAVSAVLLLLESG